MSVLHVVLSSMWDNVCESKEERVKLDNGMAGDGRGIYWAGGWGRNPFVTLLCSVVQAGLWPSTGALRAQLLQAALLFRQWRIVCFLNNHAELQLSFL